MSDQKYVNIGLLPRPDFIPIFITEQPYISSPWYKYCRLMFSKSWPAPRRWAWGWNTPKGGCAHPNHCCHHRATKMKATQIWRFVVPIIPLIISLQIGPCPTKGGENGHKVYPKGEIVHGRDCIRSGVAKVCATSVHIVSAILLNLSVDFS